MPDMWHVLVAEEILSVLQLHQQLSCNYHVTENRHMSFDRMASCAGRTVV